MSRYELKPFPSDATLAAHVAGLWLDQVAQREAAGQTISVTLSGGRITKRFFAEVVAQASKRNLSLQNVEFFWADERCVPPTDPESNYRMSEELLFKPLFIAAPRIHRIKGEIDPAQAARDAEADLRNTLPATSGAYPAIDLIFLGMGEDGHIASLFPGASREVNESTAAFLPVVAVKPPPQRITLNYGIIAAAQQVWVLASGAGKETALQDALSPNGVTPLAKVLQQRSSSVIFTDIAI